MVLKLGHFGEYISEIHWKVVKCVGEEGYRRSVGSIV